MVRNGLSVHDDKNTYVTQLWPVPVHFKLLVRVQHKATFKMGDIKDKKSILSICCVQGQKKWIEIYYEEHELKIGGYIDDKYSVCY